MLLLSHRVELRQLQSRIGSPVLAEEWMRPPESTVEKALPFPIHCSLKKACLDCSAAFRFYIEIGSYPALRTFTPSFTWSTLPSRLRCSAAVHAFIQNPALVKVNLHQFSLVPAPDSKRLKPPPLHLVNLARVLHLLREYSTNPSDLIKGVPRRVSHSRVLV